ncbi:uncharacterized protein LOC135137351 [Zophobas morio]|uniref:uncharacterized protein LOC135137351 n=1 Tax=Zophobas morio TaxID=2755281 RepID=UPI00308381FF
MHTAANEETISWHFNPPSSPHFGGLFEAGVKSVKTHLMRVVGDHLLTYEELMTLLVQIESMLNSRPLTPVSHDPNDLSALSPSHFLTFEPLVALPEPNLRDLPLNRLKRFQLIQRMFQDLWSRWSNEYLHTLHQRSKWFNPSVPINIGTLVVIKNEVMSPLHWRLDRITEVHPGNDGIIRVVTIKTKAGFVRRPVVKICPLPIETVHRIHIFRIRNHCKFVLLHQTLPDCDQKEPGAAFYTEYVFLCDIRINA